MTRNQIDVADRIASIWFRLFAGQGDDIADAASLGFICAIVIACGLALVAVWGTL